MEGIDAAGGLEAQQYRRKEIIIIIIIIIIIMKGTEVSM